MDNQYSNIKAHAYKEINGNVIANESVEAENDNGKYMFKINSNNKEHVFKDLNQEAFYDMLYKSIDNKNTTLNSLFSNRSMKNRRKRRPCKTTRRFYPNQL